MKKKSRAKPGEPVETWYRDNLIEKKVYKQRILISKKIY
jgi:hypothetical protein